MVPEAFGNALAVDMALGCSTNSVLHLPAIANEVGLKIDLDIINEISSKVPNLCKLAPAGKHHIQDLYAAGGVQAVMKELASGGLIKTHLMTCTGRTVEENIRTASVKDREVIRSLDSPYSPTGGLAILKGNLAPEGAVRQTLCGSEMLVHKGRARYSDSGGEGSNHYAGKIKPGDVVIINTRSKGGPG